MAAEREEQLKAMNKNSYDLAKDQQQEKVCFSSASMLRRVF